MSATSILISLLLSVKICTRDRNTRIIILWYCLSRCKNQTLVGSDRTCHFLHNRVETAIFLPCYQRWGNFVMNFFSRRICQHVLIPSKQQMKTVLKPKITREYRGLITHFNNLGPRKSSVLKPKN